MTIFHTESGIAPLKSKLIQEVLSDTADVAAFDALERSFTPPAGYIWNIIAMDLLAGAIPGATAGSHEFSVKTGDIVLITGSSVFGSTVAWGNSHWQNADSAKLPPESNTTLMALLNATFSNNNPIKIEYVNGTDAIASGTRTIKLYIIERSIIS